ncbi:unnamed protein product [Lathyrus sativus]|nr:unnamed protein product [Lathyrus sativus]
MVSYPNQTSSGKEVNESNAKRRIEKQQFKLKWKQNNECYREETKVQAADTSRNFIKLEISIKTFCKA